MMALRIISCSILLLQLLQGAIALAAGVKHWSCKNILEAGGQYESVMYSDKGKVVPGFEAKKHVYKEGFNFWAGEVDLDGNPILAGGRDAEILKFVEGGFTGISQEAENYYSRTDALVTHGQSYSTLKTITGEKTILAGMANSGTVAVFRPDGKKFDKLCRLPCESILSLEDGGDGFVYAATGPLGQLFRIDPKKGAYEVWGQVKDSSLRFVHRAGNGRIFVGGGESGNLYEVREKNKISVVFHFPEEVVQGMIEYEDRLLVVTNKMRKPSSEENEKLYKKYFEQFTDLNSAYGVNSKSSGSRDPMEAFLANLSSGAIYLLQDDYRVEKALSLDGEYILDIAADSQGQVFVATGPKGRVYLIKDILSDARQLWIAQDFDYENVTSIILRDGRPALFVASGNEAVLFEQAGEVSQKGVFTSTIFPAGRPAQWGKLYWKGTGVKAYSRHGNTPVPDNASWTEWIERKEGDPSELESRVWSFAQLKFEIDGGGRFEGFDYYYVEKNQRPLVRNIAVAEKGQGNSGVQREVTWEMADPNGDALVCSVWIKEENGLQWLLLTREGPVTTNKFSLDTGALPDGNYLLKVEASDEPSNYAQGLSGFSLSPTFTVDNRPPEFMSLKYIAKDGVLTGRVEDRTSLLTDLSFSMDNGAMTRFPPSDGILDEKAEEIRLTVSKDLESGLHTALLRATDEYGNQATEIITFSVEK